MNTTQKRIALVTGSNRGIGKSEALALARSGTDVIVTYRGGKQQAAAVVEKITAVGRRAVALQLDVTDPSSFDAFASRVRTELADGWGRDSLDVLVNNAGAAAWTPLGTIEAQTVRDALDMHVVGVVMLTQALEPLIADDGRIINTSSGLSRFAGEILSQTALAITLFGDESRFSGLERSVVYRWFASPESRAVYPDDDHDERARDFVADLRTAYVRDGRPSPVADVVDALHESSAEFRTFWAEHRVGRKHSQYKRLVHPEVGTLEVYCQSLFDIDQSQGLLVFTATPGSESAEKLRLLSVLSGQVV